MGFATDLLRTCNGGINNASPMLKLTIITNLTNLFNLYLNTEFTEQTKVIRFFRAFSVQIKTTFMEKIGKIGNYCQLKAVYCHKLSTQLAAFALVQLASETLLYEVAKTVTEWFYLYSVYHLANKGILKQGTSLLK